MGELAGASYHRRGALVKLIVGCELIVGLYSSRERIDNIQQVLTALDATDLELLERRHVADFEIAGVWVTDFEGLIAPAQERTLAELPSERRILRNRHIRR